MGGKLEPETWSNQTPRREPGGELPDIGLGDGFLDPKSRNKAGPHRTKRLLHSKGNRPQAKRRQAEREKVLVSDKALMSKTDREFMQLNKEKKPN